MAHTANKSLELYGALKYQGGRLTRYQANFLAQELKPCVHSYCSESNYFFLVGDKYYKTHEVLTWVTDFFNLAKKGERTWQ